MKKNKVKELWRQGKPAVVGWCSTGNPYVAELLAHKGYDGLVIDWQHGIGVTQGSVVACLQAIGNTDTVPMVRLPSNNPYYIQYVLDAGAFGIIVPMVNTPEDAEKAGRASRYAPEGIRSIGSSRASLADGLEDYVHHANDEVLCLVMIETAEALERVEEIAKAPCIDGLYIGPSDLSQATGVSITGWAADERHWAACRKILKAAQAAGVAPCHHGAGPAESAKLIKMGFMMCQVGSDIRMLSAATTSALKSFREALKD